MNTIDDKLNYLVENGGSGGQSKLELWESMRNLPTVIVSDNSNFARGYQLYEYGDKVSSFSSNVKMLYNGSYNPTSIRFEPGTYFIITHPSAAGQNPGLYGVKVIETTQTLQFGNGSGCMVIAIQLY